MRGRSHIIKNGKTYTLVKVDSLFIHCFIVFIAHVVQRVQDTLQKTLNIEHIKNSNSENYKIKEK